jgi:hypothetical protein
MLMKTEHQRAKIRCIRQVTKIPARFEYKQCLQKWKKFIIYERNLQNKVQQGIEYFDQKKLTSGFYRLLEKHRIVNEKKRRDTQIDKFYFNKQAVKILKMMKGFLEIRRENRSKFEASVMFRTSSLANKVMGGWKRYMSDNYELFIKKKALIKRLKERKCPSVFKKWSLFADKHKVYRIKSEKAKALSNSNLMLKTFASFQNNCQEHKDFRALYKKAHLFHCERLISKVLLRFKEHTKYSRDMKEKRSNLEFTICKVDRADLLQVSFGSIKLFNYQNDQYLAANIKLLEHKKMQRFFNYIRYYLTKRKNLKSRFEALKVKTESHLVSKFMKNLTKAYDIECHIKVMKSRRDLETQYVWFSECLREVNANKVLSNYLQVKQFETKEQ